MVKLSWNKFYPRDAPNHVTKSLQSPEATQEVKDGGRINFLIQGKKKKKKSSTHLYYLFLAIIL